MISRYVTKAGMAILRLPKPRDVHGLRKHINSLVDEKAFIIVNKKVTLGQEKLWLKNTIKENKLGKSFNVVVELAGDIIGSAFLKYSAGAAGHIAELGISISRQYRSLGIGTWVIKEMIKAARGKKLKIICLTVFENNRKAAALYEKLGFRVFGTLPEGVNHYGKFSDRMFMYRKV